MTRPGRGHLLTLSAADPGGLDRAAVELGTLLSDRLDIPLAEVAATTAAKPGQRCRLAFVAGSAAQAAQTLFGQGERPAARCLDARPGCGVSFLYPGIGDHYPSMAAGLYRAVPVFRSVLDACADVASAELGVDLRAAFAVTAERARDESAASERARDESAAPGRRGWPDLRALLSAPDHDAVINSPHVAQTLMFSVGYALTETLRSVGVVATALLGYSTGEYTAACAARVLAPDDAIRLVARRSTLIEQTPPGGMLAVFLPEHELERRIRATDETDLCVAAVDGPQLCVASGPVHAVDRLARTLALEGIATRRIPARHAFHSPVLAPVAQRLAASVAKAAPSEPSTPMLSNVSGTWLTAAEARDPAYWARQLTAPVRFYDNAGELWAHDAPVLMELGPGQTLGVLALGHPARPAGGVVLPTLPGRHQREADTIVLMETLGHAWTRGAAVDRSAVNAMCAPDAH